MGIVKLSNLRSIALTDSKRFRTSSLVWFHGDWDVQATVTLLFMLKLQKLWIGLIIKQHFVVLQPLKMKILMRNILRIIIRIIEYDVCLLGNKEMRII